MLNTSLFQPYKRMQPDAAEPRRWCEALSWITLVPIIFFTLFFLNSFYVVFWLRKSNSPKFKSESEKDSKSRITLIGILVFGLMIVGVLIGFGAPEIAPSSFLARFVEEGGKIIYLAWCLMIATILGIGLGILGYPPYHTRSDRDMLEFPTRFTLYYLIAKPGTTDGFPWNHGRTAGLAISQQPPELVYWAESW